MTPDSRVYQALCRFVNGDGMLAGAAIVCVILIGVPIQQIARRLKR